MGDRRAFSSFQGALRYSWVPSTHTHHPKEAIEVGTVLGSGGKRGPMSCRAHPPQTHPHFPAFATTVHSADFSSACKLSPSSGESLGMFDVCLFLQSLLF